MTAPVVCAWFALCDHPAVMLVDHPILDPVPTCQRCADRFDLHPSGFHEQADGQLVCRHRDLSVCPQCFDTTPNLVDVYGAVYYLPPGSERDQLVAEGGDNVKVSAP